VVSGTFTGLVEARQSAPSAHAAAPNITRQNLPEDGPELSPGLRAWNAGENPQANLSGNAHLVEKLGQSEVNIALQGEGLGNVQVRAHVAGDQVGAAFTVDHHDVHAALTNDLPSLHQAFAERQLRVDHLSVQQTFSSSSSGNMGTGDGRSQQQSPDSAQRQSAYAGSDSPFSSSLSSLTGNDSSETAGAFDSQGRLSVRA
jgi:flagellar hook-length control protein FliK